MKLLGRLSVNNFKKFAAVAAGALALAAGAAQANTIAYITGSDPWGETTNDAAMDAAFGLGNWDKISGFNNNALPGSYAFIYLDGGDGNGSGFDSFMGVNSGAIDAFLSGGGHLFANAARNNGFDTTAVGGGGGSITGHSNYDLASENASLTLAGAGLAAFGAGSSFTGSYFSHDIVSGVDTCYVSGDAGCVFGSLGAGLFLGGQTTTNFHNGSDPFQLRVNELTFAANGATGAVPEPATWGLMIMGFGLAGAALRSRRRMATAAI